MPILIDELSLFFPCHNEEKNLAALVDEALDALPALAARFEVIIVDDGSTDGTATLAERLVAAHPDTIRLVRHQVNRGYGGALRSGFAAARMGHVAFTDGDRQFRVADLSRLLEASRRLGAPVTVGFRAHRADPLLRRIYAGLYRLANRVWFSLDVRDVDCAMKLFERRALVGVAVASDGAFFSAELLIKLRASGMSISEVGVPHYPRVAGSATGARVGVVVRAIRDFWSLRVALWRDREAALRRGAALL